MARLAILLTAVGMGCVGAIDGEMSDPSAEAAPEGPGVPGRPGTPSSVPPAPGAPAPGAPTAPAAACTGGQEAPASRFVRLTNAQYQATVRDLLFLDPGAFTLPTDVTETGFDTHAERLPADEAHLRAYQAIAEDLAQKAISTPTVLSRLLRCDVKDAACARTFVGDFGRRAFRRPLAADEIDAYVRLHGRAGTLFPAGGDAFANGLALVIQAMLQAPDFLYRIEAGADPDGDGIAALGDFEMASRLSYMLWGTMPDETLLAAAAAGRLRTPAEVRAQAERMVADPRARPVILGFHRQWIGTEQYTDLSRDPKLFPTFAAGVETHMRAEVDRFVEHLAIEKNEGLGALLSAPFSFVNGPLAKIYGLSGTFGTQLARAELDPSRRAGLLTQSGFLAVNAHFDGTDPIARGALVLRRFLCSEPPEPPPDVDQTLPAFSPSIRTTRERVEALTSPAACRACHQIINPVGFAFEHYDAMGAWREAERGNPVDARGTVLLDGRTVPTDGAVSLVKAIADSQAARGCYARHWIQYAYGRSPSPADLCTVEQLGARPVSVKETLVALTQSRSFSNHIVGR